MTHDLPPIVRPSRSWWSKPAGVLATLLRLALLVGILWLVRDRWRWEQAQKQGENQSGVPIEQIRLIFPKADSLGDFSPDTGGQTVLDDFNYTLGYVIQTAPASDRVLGYSGPTNVLLGFDTVNKVVGAVVLRSADTEEHVKAVTQDKGFLASFAGKSWSELQDPSKVDAVSGATLTSIAIVEGIAKRVGGNRPSLRFPRGVQLDEARAFFPEAVSLKPSETVEGMIDAIDSQGKRLGLLVRTSPHSDEIIGYQGPTDTLVALSLDQTVVGFSIHDTFETEKYVEYVRDDPRFLEVLDGKTWKSFIGFDLAQSEIEGVSGATMTSLAMVKAIAAAAPQIQPREKPSRGQWITELSQRDLGTMGVVLVALVVGFTRLRGKSWIRIPFQLAVIGFLGFYVGDFVTQAVLAGWAQHGIPWQSVPGLTLLTATAFLVPPVTKRQIYCHQICPHGAVQQLIKHRLPWRIAIPPRLHAVLSCLPALLVATSIVIAMTPIAFNLANLEPFDAYVYWVAGWGSIGVAIAGLVVSLFIPMAYCRYGCPTGTVLDYTRRHGSSHRFTRKDAFVCLLFLIALGLWLR